MKDQGDDAELRYMLLCHSLGHIISKPFGDNAKYEIPRPWKRFNGGLEIDGGEKSFKKILINLYITLDKIK